MNLASLQRGLAAGVLCALTALGAAPEARAQTQRSTSSKPAKPTAKPAAAKPVAGKPAAKPAAANLQTAAATGPGGASLLASMGEWGVYTAQSGRSKICYALTQPKDRLPKNLNRDPAYLFVSFRPAENVKNEVALVLGFTAKDNGPASASIGATSFALITKDANAWLKNPAEEGQAITAMAKAQTVSVKTQSARGNNLTDQYSLSGFSAALERARKECS
ncbi:hypothetical protein [Microvirga brassicacearum]|uniref:Invasion associated locus B family protein n=1 Tax=Microvirga brassicacearum TaxID=2580413 RepID=A0A5N3PA05_9HYPH|nr:hypothetical protein [Microvirga brassicacearum]KAB0266455.1 hypothetical protein FEZ63_13905 [Microvirga brassicacearum]